MWNLKVNKWHYKIKSWQPNAKQSWKCGIPIQKSIEIMFIRIIFRGLNPSPNGPCPLQLKMGLQKQNY